MNDTETIKQFVEEYLPKILGFSYQKTNTREDAEDLSSEIALEVLKAIYSGKKIDNLNAFVWAVSNHTFFKWLRSKKHGTYAYLDDIFISPLNTEEKYIKNEKENILCREIGLLSDNYRKTIVMHYFEDKSCNEIAGILGRSVGTVKWWLHDARNSIKEGFETMREYGEKSYKPGTLFMSCQGNPGIDNEPMSLAKRKLPQNILLAAYKEARTIKDLCMELGTSAPYIEDEVKNLVDNQLMTESLSKKYQTDFVILPGHNNEMANKIFDACFPEYYQVLLSFLESHKDLLCSDELNTGRFTWDRLLWLYIHIITDIALTKFKRDACKIVGYQDIARRPNGGKWIALGYNDGSFFDQDTQKGEWAEYMPFDGPVHKTNKEFVQGYFHYWSGLDSNVFFNIPDGVFAQSRDIIKNNKEAKNLSDKQKYLFSIAIEKKLFIKDGDTFKQNYYFVDRHGREKIEGLAHNLYPKVSKYYNEAYQLVLDKYESSIPKHLHWQMGNFLSCYLGNFITCSLYEGVKNGVLSSPDDNNKEWLSLFASEY